MFSRLVCIRAHSARYARWLPLAAALLFVSPAQADDRALLTLDASIRQAIEHAPMLDARRAQLDSAQQEAARAGALPDPQLTTGIDNLDVQGPGAFQAGGDSMTMRIVGITQILPSPSKRQAERAVGNANADLAASSAMTTALSIQQEVADAWITARGAHDEAMMLQLMRQAWAQDAAVAKARLRGGTGSAAQVLAVRMEALDLENRIDEAGAREAQARASLAR